MFKMNYFFILLTLVFIASAFVMFNPNVEDDFLDNSLIEETECNCSGPKAFQNKMEN